MTSPIKKLEVIPVSVKSTNWDQSTVVIRLTDENGLTGIGEADGPPATMVEYINQDTAHGWSRNFEEMLLGRDPFEIPAIWDTLYEGSRWQGARGLGLFAISGIDMALYDLVGKQLGVPAYKLLGGAQRQALTPYMTLYPTCTAEDPLEKHLEEYKVLMDRCKSWGVKAVKMAIFTNESDRALTRFIKTAREYLDDSMELAVDFLYRWNDPYAALRVLKELDECNLYFAEAILNHDQIQGHKIVTDRINTRVCGAEMATTRFEVREWIQKAGVAIVQPDVNRCGGLTELRRIADYCELHGVELMPHCWKTGISAAASRHFQAASKVSTFFEYLHPELTDSPLREHLVTPEPVIRDGRFDLPTEPGLGIELNEAYLQSI